jgi:hypothetical protein
VQAEATEEDMGEVITIITEEVITTEEDGKHLATLQSPFHVMPLFGQNYNSV